jgi:hypothetical protein
MLHLGHQVQVMGRGHGNKWSSDSKLYHMLPSEESNILDDMDTIQKAQGIARKQNTVAMEAILQSMSDTDDFNCICQSINEDADWHCGKVWKTWKIIQEH